MRLLSSCSAPLVCAAGTQGMSLPPVGHIHNLDSLKTVFFQLIYSGGVKCICNYNQTLIKSFIYVQYHYSERTQASGLDTC